jgi:integrase
MPGRQAKLLANQDVRRMLSAVRKGRNPTRDRVIILLSVKAGLRAGEIAALTWPMVLDPRNALGDAIELHNRAAKNGGGRIIPMHPQLKAALTVWRRKTIRTHGTLLGPVIRSERGGPMRPTSIVNWFAAIFRQLGLEGCSSHSGRRTFVTKAARMVHRAGGSLRDVQQLAGHRSISMTQRYIEGDSASQRRLVRLI